MERYCYQESNEDGNRVAGDSLVGQLSGADQLMMMRRSKS